MTYSWRLLLILFTATISLDLARDGIKQQHSLISKLISTFIFMSSTTVSIISGRVVDNFGAKRAILLTVVSVGMFIVLFSALHQF